MRKTEWQRLQWVVPFLIRLVLVLHNPCPCAALLNKDGRNWGDFAASWLGGRTRPSPSSSGNISPDKPPEQILRELNLISNVDPRPLSVEPRDIPVILGASLPAVLRFGTGAFAEGYTLEIGPINDQQYTIATFGDKQLVEKSQLLSQPPRTTTMEPLVLYDREGSAACRLVREACSILSLQVLLRPCPKNGLRFASQLTKRGELKDLPILEDPNTGILGLKQDTVAILNYLFKTYGNGKIPWSLEQTRFNQLTTTLAMASRLGSGSTYETSEAPPLPLILWAYEGSPFCKRVTERLGSLELEYKIIYCPRGSPNRQKLFDLTGRFQVPYLQDPNTMINLWESSAICEYLDKKYALRLPTTYL